MSDSLRRFFRLSIVLPLVLGRPALVRAGVGSWTQFQGDAAHSGNIPAVINPSNIQPAWTVTKTQLQQNSLKSGVATDPNSVYVTGNVGNGTYQVVALNRLTGQERWRQSFVPYGSDLSQPSVSNGKVYVHEWGHSGVSGGNASQYPYVVGMNATTGSMQFATSHSGQWSSGSRPTLIDDQIYAAGGYYGGLDSYNASTGAHGWFANVNQQYGWIPAADSQRVYVYMGPASASPGPQIGTLYAFNRSNGTSDFTIQDPADSSTLYNGTVYLGQQNDALTFASGGKITSFDLLTHTVRWHASGNFTGGMAFDDGIVFATNGIELDLLNETTGSKINQWFVPAGRHLTGNIAVSDNLIFAQTDLSTYAIDRTTLQPVWSTNTVGDLAIGDGLLLISNSTSVTAFAVPEPASALLVLALGSLVMIFPARASRAG